MGKPIRCEQRMSLAVQLWLPIYERGITKSTGIKIFGGLVVKLVLSKVGNQGN